MSLGVSPPGTFQYMGAWKPPTSAPCATFPTWTFQYMGAWKPPTIIDEICARSEMFQYMGAWKPPTCMAANGVISAQVSIHGGVEAPNAGLLRGGAVGVLFQYMGAWKPPTKQTPKQGASGSFQYMGAWKPPTLKKTSFCARKMVSIHGGVEAPNS